MSNPFRKRRREDLSNYIQTDQVQSSLTYDKVGSAIKEACKSLKGFFHSDDEQALPYYMRSDCFYTRTEPYKKRPTRPLPSGMLETLKRIRKGFDPLEMTLSRWKKQNEQAQEEQETEDAEKDALIMRSIAMRKLEIEEPPNPRKKIIKTYRIDADDQANDLKWELLDKKIELALDSLQSTNNDEKYVRKSFFGDESSKPPSKVDTVITELQKADSQSLPTQSQERHQELLQTIVQNPNPEVLPEKKIQVQSLAEITQVESKLDQPKPTSVVNPFKDGPSKPPLTLMEMISKNKQTPFIPNQEAQSQVTYSSKQSGQNQTANPFQTSIKSYTSIQSQQTIQSQPSFASSSHHQAANTYFVNQHSNPFANKGSQIQGGQFFQNNQDNSHSRQGNQAQNSPSFQNYQKNQTQPQLFVTNPPPNTFSSLDAKELKGMFASNHQSHKQSLGLFDKTSTATSDKGKKKGPTYRNRKDQIRVS